MKRTCPVCKNEEIREDHNFCMIYGFDLQKEKAPEAVESCRGADELNHPNHIIESRPNQVPAEILSELVAIQKRIREIYQTTGLYGMGGSDGIHLSNTAFLDTFQDYESSERGSEEYPEELFATFNGVKFFCIR